MKYKLVIVVTALALFTTLLSACKGNKQILVPPNEEPIKVNYEEIRIAPSPGKLPVIAKDRKDTLVVGINTPNGRFNPIFNNSTYDSWVCGLVFDGLISNDENGNPIASIAKQWNISEDAKSYTFILREDIKFSDGSDLTSEDVAFTYTALCDPKYSGSYGNSFRQIAGYKQYAFGSAKELSGIKVVNKYEITFTFAEVKTSVINDFVIGILPRKYYDYQKGDIKSVEDKNLKPLGSGAYKLVDYKIGEEIVFEKNPSYFKGEPSIPKIQMKINKSNSNSKGLLEGNIDINKIAATPQNAETLKEVGFLDMHLYDTNGYQYIGLNLRKDMFKDKRVRQALLYGINRAEFVNSYYGEFGIVYNTPFAKCSWAYPDGINEYAYDKDKANKLLDEAGWVKKEDGWRYNSEGKKFTIKWSTYEGNKYVEKLIPLVKENWKDLGIEVTEELMLFSNLVEKVYDKRDFDMYNMSWTLNLDPDPSLLFSVTEDTPGGNNAVGWKNDQSEKLIKDGLKQIDQQKRKAIYNEWGKLANEELPYLYLSQNKELFAVSTRVKNIRLSSYVDWTTNAYKLQFKIYE